MDNADGSTANRPLITPALSERNRSRSRESALPLTKICNAASAASNRLANAIQCSNGHSLRGVLALIEKWIEAGVASDSTRRTASSGLRKSQRGAARVRQQAASI